MTQKRRIAFFGVGLLGIPLLNQIIKRLSDQYDLTIYSFIRVDATSIPDKVRVRSSPNKMHQRLKYIGLSFCFVYDHLRSPYHVLHAQSAFPGGVLARRLAKIFELKWIVTLIGGEVECSPEIPFGDLRNAALRPITKRVCAEASILTVMSFYQANSVRKNLRIEREIVVLPYAPVIKSLKEKKLSSSLKLLHIAYHHPVKNHSMLLKCLDMLRKSMPVHLTIIGANYDEHFRGEIESYGLQNYITLAGVVSHNSLDAYFDDAHILIHTSWYEGLPAVAIEAMAAGLVVCGTKVGIISDLAGQFAIAADVDNHEALSSAIVKLSQDSEEYERIRSAAHRWAEEHDQTVFVKTLVSHYEMLSEMDLRKS